MHILEVNSTPLAEITLLQGNNYRFNGNLEGIIWKSTSQGSLVRKHQSEMKQILRSLGWVEDAIILAAKINTRDERVSWNLENVSEPEMGQMTEFNKWRPFLTLTFPLLHNLLKSRVYH